VRTRPRRIAAEQERVSLHVCAIAKVESISSADRTGTNASCGRRQSTTQQTAATAIRFSGSARSAVRRALIASSNRPCAPRSSRTTVCGGVGAVEARSRAGTRRSARAQSRRSRGHVAERGMRLRAQLSSVRGPLAIAFALPVPSSGGGSVERAHGHTHRASPEIAACRPGRADGPCGEVDRRLIAILAAQAQK